MTSFPVHNKLLITRKRCYIEQNLQLTTNRKSGSAFQNPPLNSTRGATSRRNRYYVISCLQKSLISRKRCYIQQNLQLNTNRKSGSAFQNPPLNSSRDAT